MDGVFGTHSVSIEEFGASAAAAELYKHFGITADAIQDAARGLLTR
jgi:transketolase